MNRVKDMAECSEFMDSITLGNALLLYEHILYYNVTEKRTRQLEAIKEGFNVTGLEKFLQERKYLTSGVFPGLRDLVFPVSLILEKITCTPDEHPILYYVKEYINELSTRKHFSSAILLHNN